MVISKFVALLPIFMVFLAGCVGYQTTQQQQAEPEATPTPPQETTTPPTPQSSSTPTQTPTEMPLQGVVVSTKEFKVTIDHSGGYSPNKITVNKGDTVKILATSNQPPHRHGIAIDAYNINTEVTSSTVATTVEFVADKTGTFEIYCKTCLDGPLGPHPQLKGTLEVK